MEPQLCSSLILSCSEPGTSGPFWRWIGTVFEELSQTWKWIYNREAAVWSRGLWCHVECHMVINKFKWQKCLPSQGSRGCLRDKVSQWGLRGGELTAQNRPKNRSMSNRVGSWIWVHLYHTVEYIFHVQDARKPLLKSLITIMINNISILPLFSLSYEEKRCFFPHRVLYRVLAVLWIKSGL